MDALYVIKGVIIGLAIGAPVGPIGIICIHRILAKGRECGLASGLGAATADALYGFIVGFGLIFIENLLVNHQDWLRPLGGLIVCGLGLKTYLSHPDESRGNGINGLSLLRAYTSVFFLTFTNPVTLLATAAIFVGLGVAGVSGNLAHTGLLVLGIFSGSAFWWILLSGTIGLIQAKSNNHVLLWINRVSGVLLIVFGVLIMLNMVGLAGHAG
jgi:threonine/homoserine/homoserine lactone efflux protein